MYHLSETVFERATALVERYGLHEDGAILPVPILQVAKDEGWRVCYHSNMKRVAAMAFLVEGTRLLYVNENLTQQAQRAGIAHELGHVLAGHSISAVRSRSDVDELGRLDARQEWEAEVIAALLLIPSELRDAPLSDQEVARECRVPVGLVRLFRSVCWPCCEDGLAAD